MLDYVERNKTLFITMQSSLWLSENNIQFIKHIGLRASLSYRTPHFHLKLKHLKYTLCKSSYWDSDHLFGCDFVLTSMPYTPADLTSIFKAGWRCTIGIDLEWGGMMNSRCFLIAHAICHTPVWVWLPRPRHCVTVSGWIAAVHCAVSARLGSPNPSSSIESYFSS